MMQRATERLSLSDAINRGYNMLIVTVLGLTALAFGTDIIPEAMDKLVYITDDVLIAIIGVAAVAWYFVGRNCYARTSVPILLVSLALLAQVAGFVIEIGDIGDLGDDIAGLVLFVALLVISVVLYSVNGRLLERAKATGDDGPTVA